MASGTTKAAKPAKTSTATKATKPTTPTTSKKVAKAASVKSTSAVPKKKAAGKAVVKKTTTGKTVAKKKVAKKAVRKKAVSKKTVSKKAAGSAKVAKATKASTTPTSAAMAVAMPGAVLPDFPPTEYAVVEKLLVGFLSSEIRKVGLHRAVLGLSGGIDSAVSAAVAARALGPENVLGVMMPYQSSSPESLADANAVAENLGIETLVVEITDQVDSYFERFPDASKLRRGNKMARERMTILYDHSAERSALVIGTSNKTELLLGYGTLFGDMASALNPIGDLYKTQVWDLARHLGLPSSVIEKAPTADLWSGQTDEIELGFSYYDADKLLYRMIDERCRHSELAEMGFDPVFVDRVSRMVRSSQFKRRLPVIAKLSARSIDTDFRYSRDWGL